MFYLTFCHKFIPANLQIFFSETLKLLTNMQTTVAAY